MEKTNAIIGLVVNDSSKLQCLAYLHRNKPWFSRTDNDCGDVGVGHYFGGETLLNTRPSYSPRDLLLSDIFPQKGAQFLLAQASMSSGASQRLKTKSVARWRNWLFACDDQIDWGDRRAEIVESLPRFLGQIAAGGNNELLFGHFLAGLHENQLVDLQTHPKKLAMQLHKTAQLIDTDVSILVSNGNVLLAYRRGNPLYYRILEGIDLCERCTLKQMPRHDDTPVVSHNNFRGICVTNRPFGENKMWSESPDVGVLVIESATKCAILNDAKYYEIEEGK